MSARAQLELKFVREVKDNRKVMSKYTDKEKKKKNPRGERGPSCSVVQGI